MAEVVRLIFDWYLQGDSVGVIIKKLEQQGIKTSTGKDKWSKWKIDTMLSYDKYAGNVILFKKGLHSECYLSKKNHPAIISEETYKAVQWTNVEITEDGVSGKERGIVRRQEVLMRNNVVKILSDYWEWEKTKLEKGYANLSKIEKDKLRLENDNDVKYYFNKLDYDEKDALRADTITSFWTPYRTLLKKEAGWVAYKTSRSLESLLKQINATWSNAFTAKINEINSKLDAFASVCYTPGNYMILPKRVMNIHRYQETEDRID